MSYVKNLEVDEKGLKSVKESFVGVVMWHVPGCSRCEDCLPLFNQLAAEEDLHDARFAVAHRMDVDGCPPEFPSFDIYRRKKLVARVTGPYISMLEQYIR